MNQMAIEEDGQTATISLVVDSKMVELQRNRVRRYTNETLQAEYAGDTFFSYTSDLQDKEIVLGRKNP